MRYSTIVADPPWNVLRPAGGLWRGGRVRLAMFASGLLAALSGWWLWRAGVMD